MEWVLVKQLIITLILGAYQVHSVTFDRKYTGVGFSPYIKGDNNYNNDTRISSSSTTDYTMENMRTMLEVVSTKFSRIYAYFYYSYVRARTAEAAALINRTRKRKSLTVLIAIVYVNIETRLKNEVRVAVESAQIANSIFPGTVEGLVFTRSNTTSLDWAKNIIYWLDELRNITSLRDLKIGTEQPCNGLILSEIENADSESKEIWDMRSEIVSSSDFIMCPSSPSENTAKQGAKYSVSQLKPYILQYRRDINEINPDIEVMWHTQWANSGKEIYHNVTDFRNYWMEVNNFASENNYTVFLNWAFDNPKLKPPYIGWWKLSRNDLINNASAYVERISGKFVELPIYIAEEDTSTTSFPDSDNDDEKSQFDLENMTYYAIIGIVALVSSTVLSFIMCSKWKALSRRTFLTQNDVEEFKHGVLDKDNKAANPNPHDSLVNVHALKLPYDTSLEISKSKLKILWEECLGGGEFGLVYKAIIQNGREEELEVALKMAKENSPSSALKALLSEIKIMTYLGQHENLVSICGAYTAEMKKGIIYLALELCPLGSLKKHLGNCYESMRQQHNTTVESSYVITYNSYENTVRFNDNQALHDDMIRWSYEIACGMEYLSAKNVIHADLATRNVLLTLNKTAKVADFGLSRRLYEYSIYTKSQHEPLPWRWMAIESLKRTEFSIKSDVWSYGVTIWEIFTLGDQPYPGITWSLEFVESLEGGLRLKQPLHSTLDIYDIMKRCWERDPDDRPTFAELKDSFINLA